MGTLNLEGALETYSDVFENLQSENVAKVDDYLNKLGINTEKVSNSNQVETVG